MKPSKKQSAIAGKNDAQKPCDCMQIAANVFSNYVLAPAPRGPGQQTREEAIHGAALLVFHDEVQEKIPLRTGFPARVAHGNQSSAAGEGKQGRRADDKE